MAKELLKNHQYCKETINLKEDLEAGYLSLAERLTKIRNEELYKPEWDEFSDFLEEMQMSQSTASKLINIHLKFVVKMEIPRQVLLSLNGYSDLADLLAVTTTKKETVDLIEELAPLRRIDRRKLLQERKTGVEMGDCKHKDTYTIRICKDCGNREKLYD